MLISSSKKMKTASCAGSPICVAVCEFTTIVRTRLKALANTSNMSELMLVLVSYIYDNFDGTFQNSEKNTYINHWPGVSTCYYF